jgi:hypothetical protein
MEAGKFLSDTVKGSTKSLFKSFLVLIEDLHAENKICFDKLKRHMPEHADLIDQANYLDEDKMQYLRKKILDIGNESMRENNSNIEKFTVNFKF